MTRLLLLLMVTTLVYPSAGGMAQDGGNETGDEGFIINGDEDVAEVNISATDAEGLVIDVLIRGLKVEEWEEGGEAFQILTISSRATTSEVGKPQLPMIKEIIAVPRGASVRAEVLDASYSTYSGYRVFPYQPPEVDGEDQAFVIDEEFYSQDIFYPEEILEVGGSGTWRDLEVVEVQVNPVLFNPARGELRVYDRVRVRIDYGGGTLAEETAEPKFARMYEDVILNYESIGLKIREAEARERELPLPGDVGIDAPGQTTDLVKYLSIRHDGHASYDSIKPLLDLRAEKGIPVVSYSFSSSSNPSASDVKDVIAGVYASHPELEYVLLVGDIDHLPWYANWPGDYWYGCVAGSDLYPELAVGRISANDDSEVSQQVNKILEYEKNPPAGDWFRRVLLIAHAQEAPGKYQGCKETIRGTNYAYPFAFETAYGALSSKGGDEAANAHVKEAIDSGMGIVNYRGHGDRTYWGPDWNYLGEEYGTADAHALNNGGATPIFFSIACYNAALDYSGESLAEAFVKDDGSAVAFLGATRPSYTIENHDFDRYLFDAIGNEDIRDLGWVLNDANVELIAKYGAASYAAENVKMYLLLGDPALEVRLDEPNSPPGTPDRPTGPVTGCFIVPYSYSTRALDPDGDQVKYIFNWGDGTASETEFVDSGVNVSESHSWSSEGIYYAKVRAVDNHGSNSEWSDPVEVAILPRVNRVSGNRRSGIL